MPNVYSPGTAVRFDAAFEDANGVGADPDTITFYIRAPGAATSESYVWGTDPEVIRDSAGVYHLILVRETVGRHTYEWEGTGAVAITKPGVILVKHSGG